MSLTLKIDKQFDEILRLEVFNVIAWHCASVR